MVIQLVALFELCDSLNFPEGRYSLFACRLLSEHSRYRPLLFSDLKLHLVGKKGVKILETAGM